MGIEGRDYFRDGRYSASLGGWGFGSSRLPPMVKFLLLANIVVFLLQIFITRDPRPEDVLRYIGDGEIPADVDISVVQEWFQLETDKVVGKGQLWRLLTSAFCHDRFGIWHILMNMLFLYWFGAALESMYGSREFILFYIVGALAASAAYVGLDLITGESIPAIGASGAVMAVTMLYAIHYPRQKILLFFFIPIEIRWLIVLYVLFDLHPVLLALAGDRQMTGVAHAAHLGGLIFGFVYWKTNLRLSAWLPKGRRRRPPRGWSVVDAPPGPPPEPDELDRQVDAILQKIHEQGEASLTDQERETLKEAARRRR